MRDAALSKTYWGLLIAILGPVAARYGVDDAQFQALAQAAAALIGGILAIYGRQTATGPITSVVGVDLPKALVPQSAEEPKP